jgi:hypothetical protein
MSVIFRKKDSSKKFLLINLMQVDNIVFWRYGGETEVYQTSIKSLSVDRYFLKQELNRVFKDYDWEFIGFVEE